MNKAAAIYSVRSLRFRPAELKCEWIATLVCGSRPAGTLISRARNCLEVEFALDIYRDHFLSYAKEQHPHLTPHAAAEEELAILIYAAYAGQRAQTASHKHVVFTLHDDLGTPYVIPGARMSQELIGSLQLAYGARLARVYGRKRRFLPRP